MFKNYLKIALRNLQNQRLYTFINVFGLSVGMSCFILIASYSKNELSFDRFHANASNVFRPYVWWPSVNGQPAVAYTDYSGPTAATLGEAMKHDLPDIESFVRFQLPNDENLIRIGNDVHRVKVTYADPSIFSIFSFPLKYGSIQSALQHSNDIVLTESMAKELFRHENPVGRRVQIKIGTSFEPFTVSGVAKDVPDNSTIRFDVLGNFSYALANNSHFFIGNNWHPTVVQTYVQLRSGSSLPSDQLRLTRFIETFDPAFVSNIKSTGIIWKGDQPPSTLKLQPLLTIHTDTWFNAWGFVDYDKMDLKTIWILLTIGFGIMLIGCINFTTLAIARSASRGKEVGVRKVIGAEKGQLFLQFIFESIFLSTISTAIGLFLAYLLLPMFNQLSDRELHFGSSLTAWNISLLVGTVFLVGLLAGAYPAFMLSRFKVIEVLKNKFRIGGSNLFTKSLIGTQFVLSIGLVISTIVVLQQARHLRNKNPGFDKENVVSIDAAQVDPSVVFPVFKQQLLGKASVIGIASSAAGLGAGEDYLGYSDKGLSAAINIIDPDYIRVLGMKIVSGHNFNPVWTNDSIRPMIINETMMKGFGWTLDNAIGKQIKGFQNGTAVVLGIVRDFNYRPLREAVKNQAFIMSKDKGYVHFYVRINPGNPAAAIDMMQKVWMAVAPGIPMKYSFLDEDIDNYYTTERKWSNVIGLAGGISIFLACLGLLGLASIAAVNRTKEIGVRRVLGASVPDILALLSKNFIQLLFISFIIASPLAWLVMNKWLESYADRIHMAGWVFVTTGAGVILVAFLTIASQAIKAALANPVKSLRTE